MRFILFHETAVWRGTVGCHIGRALENRLSPTGAAILSTAYFLPVRNAAPEHLLFVSPICSVFLFVLFLPLPQNSKKGLVAWQVWRERSARTQLLPLLEQSCCFVSLWVPLANTLPRNCERISINIYPVLVYVTQCLISVFSPNATCVVTC